MIERLHAAGARLIVYDIAFDQATDELDDEALLEAASQDPPIVFATSLISPTGQTQVLGGNASVAGIGDRVAASDLPADGDGVLRHTLGQANGLPTIAAVVSLSCSATPSRRRSWKGAGSTSGEPRARSRTCPSRTC